MSVVECLSCKYCLTQYLTCMTNGCCAILGGTGASAPFVGWCPFQCGVCRMIFSRPVTPKRVTLVSIIKVLKLCC